MKKSTDSSEPIPFPNLKPREEPRRGPGRPKKLPRPNLPDFEMSDLEREWFDYHYNSYLSEFPDLSETDRMWLLAASLEYVKYLRMVTKEMSDRELVSMARQHPLTQYRSLMMELSVTRKARLSKSQLPEEKESDRLLTALAR